MQRIKAYWVTGVVCLMIALCVVILSIGKDAIQLNRQGDAAIFEQLLDNIYSGRGAVSNVFANTQNYIDNNYAVITEEELLNKNLDAPQPQERNMLQFHAYYCLFLLAGFKFLWGSSLALTIFQVSAYILLLAGTVYFIKSQTKSLVLSVLGGLFVFLNPNWFIGIMGQFYPDRLFVCVGFFLLYALHIKCKLWQLVVIAVLIATINERAALIAGLVIGAHQALFVRVSDYKRAIPPVCVAVVLIVYFYIQKNFVLSNVYYAGYMPGSWQHFLVNWNAPGFSAGLWSNVLNNAPLLILSLFAPRYFLISLAVLLPNWVGNIGGAEKVGWLTHYHSYYFPVLVFSSAVGMLNLYSFCQKNSSTLKSWYLHAALLVVLIFLNFQQTKGNLNGYMIKPMGALNTYTESFSAWRRGEKTGLDLRAEVKTFFKFTDVVATTEMGMALLHDKVRVVFYPVGLNEANMVFIPCTAVDKFLLGSKERYNSVSFNQEGKEAAALKSLSYCLLSKE